MLIDHRSLIKGKTGDIDQDSSDISFMNIPGKQEY